MHDATRELDLFEAYGPDEGRVRAAEYVETYAAGDAEAERLAMMPPGPELAAALAASQQLLMSAAGRMKVYASWERQAAWTQAESMAALVAAAGQQPDDDSDRSVVADVALLTCLSEASVGNRLGQARHVGAGLPQTWDALHTGRLTPTHAWVMGNVTRNAPPELAAKVEDEVLEKSIEKRRTPAQLGEEARRSILRLDPEGAAERAADAKKHRSDVRLRPDEDEMAHLSTWADAWTGRQVMDEINRRADSMRSAGDDRNLGELRVQALADAVLGSSSSDDATSSDATAAGTQGRRPKRATALLLVSLDTLLGASEPGHLDGYGPITAQLARQIAAGDLQFRRLLLDAQSGKPESLSTEAYELPAEVRRWLDVRDRTCRFPRCRRRAAFCDADHAVEWPEGKTTCENCGLLCRRHHNFKTTKQWWLRRNPDDSVDWVSPHGFEWHTEPATYEEFVGQPDLGDAEPWVDDGYLDLGPPPDEVPLPAHAPEPDTPEDEDYDLDLMYARLDAIRLAS